MKRVGARNLAMSAPVGVAIVMGGSSGIGLALP